MAKLYFYYSAMNAGKSTMLLQSSYNYRERGMSTLLFTPKLDNRYAIGKVHSRIGLESDAMAFDDDDDLYQHTKSFIADGGSRLACVLVDEAQFLSRAQVMQLSQIVDELAVPVLAYGIRTDYRGELFDGSQQLLAWADELVEIKTVCHCGRKALMNMRIDKFGEAVKQGEQIMIGGNESYVATCRQHFKLGVTQTVKPIQE